jgi:hypothetical protein
LFGVLDRQGIERAKVEALNAFKFLRPDAETGGWVGVGIDFV